MRAQEAVGLVRQALVEPVQTWPGYSPAKTPLCVYDGSEHIFLNHPAPPRERPAELTAATACDIAGVMTALLPAALCPDEVSLVSLLYHECFHVYQNTGAFGFAEQYDFFRCLAYYPELDPQYRACCAAEADVLNDPDLQPAQRASYLAALTKRRYELLKRVDDLIQFESSSERREGTAYYVEGRAVLSLFGKSPEPVSAQYGWSRQYAFGAAVCRLLEQVLGTGWEESVAKGLSPSEALCSAFGDHAVDVTPLHLEDSLETERHRLTEVRSRIRAQLAEFRRRGVTRIHLPQSVLIRRSFSPVKITSLGGGLLLYDGFLVVQLPSGTVSVRGAVALEDCRHGVLIVPRLPVGVSNGNFTYESDTISAELAGVTQAGPDDIVVR